MEEIFCIGEIFVDRGADLGHCDAHYGERISNY